MILDFLKTVRSGLTLCPQKWGNLRENERRVHAILRLPAGISPVFRNVVFMNMFPPIKCGELVLDSVDGCGTVCVVFGDPRPLAHDGGAA
jgi:hypothetical protein